LSSFLVPGREPFLIIIRGRLLPHPSEQPEIREERQVHKVIDACATYCERGDQDCLKTTS